jgi:hypothetical protein
LGEAERRLRVAVIGASGYEHGSGAASVECFRWNELRKIKNLADYDVVVLNVLSLDRPEDMDAEAFRTALDVRTTRQILQDGSGSIFVLGDPRFDLPSEFGGRVYAEPFLSWTGLEFSWDDRGGVAVEKVWPNHEEGPIVTYASNLDRYRFSMVGCRPFLDEEEGLWGIWGRKELEEEGLEASVSIEGICANRYGQHVAFIVNHTTEPVVEGVRRHVGGRTYTTGVEPKPASGPIVFLPESRLSEEQTLELVLRDMFGVELSAPEPEWIGAFRAPGQEEVDETIAEIDAQIETLLERREELLCEREEVRRPLGLLYQTGDALEEAVWSVLEALGAEVERPEKGSNLEDGWVTVRLGDDVLEFVLEIKGVDREHFDFKGLRQLTDWVSNGIDLRGKEYKGLLVGNSSLTQPPRRRVWPFNNNFVGNAEKRRHAAIRSEDLYVLYLLNRRGELDREEFWRKLYETRGPFDMRPHRKKLTAEEVEQLENLAGA